MVKPVLLRCRHIVQQHIAVFKHVSDIVTEKRRNETLEQKAVWLEKKRKGFLCSEMADRIWESKTSQEPEHMIRETNTIAQRYRTNSGRKRKQLLRNNCVTEVIRFTC